MANVPDCSIPVLGTGAPQLVEEMPQQTIHTLVILNTATSMLLMFMFGLAILWDWGLPWTMIAAAGIPLAVAVFLTSVRLEKRFLDERSRNRQDAEGKS